MSKSDEATKLVFETQIEANQKLFSVIQEDSPKLAAALKSDFEAYLQCEVELFKKSGGAHGILDVKKKLPGNKWVDLLEGYFSRVSPATPEEKEQIRKNFRADLQKRKKRRDIQ